MSAADVAAGGGVSAADVAAGAGVSPRDVAAGGGVSAADVAAGAPGVSPRDVAAGGGVSPRGVEARLWDALRTVQDPEIPVSVVGMGLIVSVDYVPDARRADLRITFTAMGCPAMDFIEDDIREALLRDPDVDAVQIEVVWDPVWTKDRIRADAREKMRELGIVA